MWRRSLDFRGLRGANPSGKAAFFAAPREYMLNLGHHNLELEEI
jgi:hypothetical protein